MSYCQGCADRDLIIQSRNAKLDRYRDALIEMYLESPVLVARVCDEIIDRSGRLLGELRIEAREAREQQKATNGDR